MVLLDDLPQLSSAKLMQFILDNWSDNQALTSPEDHELMVPGRGFGGLTEKEEISNGARPWVPGVCEKQ